MKNKDWARAIRGDRLILEIAQARREADSDRARSSVNKAEGLQPSSLDNFIGSRRGGDRSDEGLWYVLFVLIPFLVIDKC